MLDNWQSAVTVPLFTDDGETETEYRLTFKTLTTLDVSRMNRARAAAVTKLVDELGEYTSLEGDAKDDFITIFDQIVKAVAINAALATVEEKRGDDWVASSVPDGWQDVYSFSTTAPAFLIDDLFSQVIEAGNPPRLFSLMPTTDDEKKMIRVRVNKSDN